MKTVYLIDSSIYMFRAWHMMPDTIRTTGNQPANAVYGFSEFLLQILDKESPTHLACAFDESREHSARKKIYPDYKSNRPPLAEDLKNQFNWCREFAVAMGIPCFSSLSLEADDIIGTFAQQNRDHSTRSIIISADKDLAQFIGQNDILWDFARKNRQSYRDICKRFNLSPNQIPDMLAIAGDKVDNIPGVPGVGMHTAARLLYKWGSIENLFCHLEEAAEMKFRGARRICKLVEEHQDTVLLSRKLTGLFWVDDLPPTPDGLVLGNPDMEKLNSLFSIFEFSDQRIKRWLKSLKID